MKRAHHRKEDIDGQGGAEGLGNGATFDALYSAVRREVDAYSLAEAGEEEETAEAEAAGEEETAALGEARALGSKLVQLEKAAGNATNRVYLLQHRLLKAAKAKVKGKTVAELRRALFGGEGGSATNLTGGKRVQAVLSELGDERALDFLGPCYKVTEKEIGELCRAWKRARLGSDGHEYRLLGEHGLPAEAERLKAAGLQEEAERELAGAAEGEATEEEAEPQAMAMAVEEAAQQAAVPPVAAH
jgi:hypothetical protein